MWGKILPLAEILPYCSNPGKPPLGFKPEPDEPGPDWRIFLTPQAEGGGVLLRFFWGDEKALGSPLPYSVTSAFGATGWQAPRFSQPAPVQPS